jgi:hypothetical protein
MTLFSKVLEYEGGLGRSEIQRMGFCISHGAISLKEISSSSRIHGKVFSAILSNRGISIRSPCLPPDNTLI